MPASRPSPACGRAASLICLAVGLLLGQTAHAWEERPNILFVLADDYGVDKSPLYTHGGVEVARTPTLEYLANTGVLFRRGWSAPNCTPTRAQLITGQYGFRTGIVNVVGPPNGTPELDVSLEHLLPKRLAAAGYATAMIGKWQLNFRGNNNQDFSLPIQAGYDYFFGTMGSFPIDRNIPGTIDDAEVIPLGEPLGGADYFVPTFAPFGRCDNLEGVGCGRLPGETPPADPASEVGTARQYAISWTVDETLRWIYQQTGPWFVNLSLHGPHAPFVVPPRHLVERASPQLVAAIEHEFGHYPEGALVRSSADPTRDDRKAELTYAAMIAAIDSEIGRLIHHLSPHRTIVIFMGDNGTPATVASASVDNRKVKSSYYDLGSRVPYIVAGARVTQGLRSNAFVNTTDVYATILDLAGAPEAPTDVTIDGLSFAPVLRCSSPDFTVRHVNYTEIGLLFQDFNPGIDQRPRGSFGAYEGNTVRDHRYELILSTDFEGERDGAINVGFPTLADGVTLGSYRCVQDPQPSESNPAPCASFDRVKAVEFYDLWWDPSQIHNLVEYGPDALDPWQRNRFEFLADRLETLLERPGIVRNALSPTPRACGLGVELTLLLPALMRLRGRRRSDPRARGKRSAGTSGERE